MAMNVEKVVVSIVLLLVGVILIFQIMASLSAPLGDAADQIAAQSSVWGSLVSLFEKGGILFIVILIGVFLGLLFVAFSLFKRSR